MLQCEHPAGLKKLEKNVPVFVDKRDFDQYIYEHENS